MGGGEEESKNEGSATPVSNSLMPPGRKVAKEPMSAAIKKSDPFDFLSGQKNFIHEQTKVFLSTENGGFREYIIKLFGSDIYFYTDES
jgi:hypothetical protein